MEYCLLALLCCLSIFLVLVWEEDRECFTAMQIMQLTTNRGIRCYIITISKLSMLHKPRYSDGTRTSGFLGHVSLVIY